jgi:hypothetical protein
MALIWHILFPEEYLICRHPRFAANNCGEQSVAQNRRLTERSEWCLPSELSDINRRLMFIDKAKICKPTLGR